MRYEGDARPGMSVEGHTFAEARPAFSAPQPCDDSMSTGSAGTSPAEGGLADALRNPFERDHFHGFGQSPQRSR